MKLRYLSGAAFVAAAFAASVAQAQTKTIAIDGSSTVFPVSEAIAEEFQKSTKGAVRVTVGISGTGGGFKKFCRGETDISNGSRPILKEEIEACKQAGIEFYELPIAFDALTVAVSPKNTFLGDCITVAELKKIWEPGAQGKVMSWSDVKQGLAEPEDHALRRGRGLGHVRLLHRGRRRKGQGEPRRLHRQRGRQRARPGHRERRELARLHSLRLLCAARLEDEGSRGRLGQGPGLREAFARGGHGGHLQPALPPAFHLREQEVRGHQAGGEAVRRVLDEEQHPAHQGSEVPARFRRRPIRRPSRSSTRARPVRSSAACRRSASPSTTS